MRMFEFNNIPGKEKKGQFFIISIIFIVITVIGIGAYLKNVDKDIIVNPVEELSVTYGIINSLDNDVNEVLSFHNYSVSEDCVYDLNLLASTYVDVLAYNNILANIVYYLNDTTTPVSIWEYADVSYNYFYLHRRRQIYP